MSHKVFRIARFASAAVLGSFAAYWTLLATRQGHMLAERDDVVLPERSQKLIAAWPTPVSVQTIAGSDHHSIIVLEATWLHLVDFALTAVLPEPKAA